MKAAEWKYFDEMAIDFPFFTDSLTLAVKAEEEAHWKSLSRQWWAEADAYEDAVLEAAWDAQERAFYAQWEEEAFREEIEEEAAYDNLLRAGEEILAHLRGQDTVLWDKDKDGKEVKSASISIPSPVKTRSRALRRRNNAAHRGKSEKGESPFFSTNWLKSQASRRVRRSTSVPSRGGFKKVVSFYAL